MDVYNPRFYSPFRDRYHVLLSSYPTGALLEVNEFGCREELIEAVVASCACPGE